MGAPRNDPGWMTLLDVSHTEERISSVRAVIFGALGLLVIVALADGCLTRASASLAGVIVFAGIAAALVSRAHAAKRTPQPVHWFVNNAIDTIVVSGVVLISLHAEPFHFALAACAELAYFLLIFVAGWRLHVPTTLFSAGLCAGEAVAIALYASLAPARLAPSAPVVAAPESMIIGAVFLLGAGALAVAIVGRAQRGVATLEEAEKIHRRVINQVSDGLMVCNAQGRIVEVNAAACDVLGLPRSVLIDLEATKVLPVRLASTIEERWQEALEMGVTSATGVRIEREGGDRRVLDVAAYRVRHRGEDVLQLVLRDSTAERELRAQRSDVARFRSLRTMASGIAHEFNNMFASIEASSYLLSEAIPKTAPEATEVEIIRGAARRATELVRELLDLSDVRKPEATPLDVLSIVEKALVSGREDGQARVSVALDVSVDVQRIWGEEVQLVRALGNLVGCSYAAMLDGGTLTIRAENTRLEEGVGDLVSGDYVVIRVQDTGIGIPADMLDRAFDPFFANDGRRWAGFALATVRSVIARHGGMVTLESTLGRGTTYTVYLPATKKPSPRDARRLLSRASEPTKARLLVVDDEPANRTSLARLLSTRGYEVELAEDGRSAIELCERECGRFDLVLLDVVMPGLNGKDVVVALRARYPDIKVMLVTGFADRDLVEEAIALGAVSCALKPFDVPELLDRIQALVSSEPVSSERPVSSSKP